MGPTRSTLGCATRCAAWGVGDGDAEPAEATAAVPPLQEAAVFAGEVSVLGEADLGMTFGERIDELEHRLVRLERGPAARARRLAESLRS